MRHAWTTSANISMWEFKQVGDHAMTLTEGIKRVETDLKSIRAAIRAVRKDVAGRKGAESGDNAAAAEKLDALLGMVDGLGSTVRQVTGEIKKETKARAAVETERDKALKTVEKMAETAEAAGSESDGQKTQITYLKDRKFHIRREAPIIPERPEAAPR